MRARTAGLAIGLCAILLGNAHSAFAAGTRTSGPYSSPRNALAIGSTCKRRTDNDPGVVKMDACRRMYCGRAAVKDIIELLPNFAQINHCTWQLTGDHCKCHRDTTKASFRK